MTTKTALLTVAGLTLAVAAGAVGGVTYERVADHYAITAPEPCRSNRVVHADGTSTTFPGLEARGVQICGSVIYADTSRLKEAAAK